MLWLLLAVAAWGIDLVHGPQNQGASTTYTATNTTPGGEVAFVRSVRGEGAGPCVGPVCLDVLAPVEALGVVTADGTGRAELMVDLPWRVASHPTWTQAIDRATGDESAVVAGTILGRDGLYDEQDLALADATIETGDAPDDGVVTVLGDLDLDGYVDVAVSHPDEGFGVVRVFSGPIRGELQRQDAVAALWGEGGRRAVP